MPGHYLRIADLPARRALAVISLARELKRRRGQASLRALEGRMVGLLMQGPSLRTRVSFELAIRECGGSVLYIDPEEFAAMLAGDLMLEVALLARSCGCLVARIYDHTLLEQVALRFGRPVVNAMSKLEHPCQALSDVLTIVEHCGRIEQVEITCVAQGTVANSLAILAAGLGARVRIACPPGAEPPPAVFAEAARYGLHGVQRVVVEHNLAAAVAGADVLYTDRWVDPVDMYSPAEERHWRAAAQAYQINQRVMALAKPTAIFMHCLPAQRGAEVADDVIDGPQSVVLDQAENRLHAQKALLLTLLANIDEVV